MSNTPLVLVADQVRLASPLADRYPGRVGLLFGPSSQKPNPKGLPYGLDNGRFPIWTRGGVWDEAAFLRMIERAQKFHAPRWLVVPDVVADARRTLDEWASWEARLRGLGWPLALAVQDGMAPESVKVAGLRPDVIFVGGSTGFKWATLDAWCAAYPRVHVGRVNGLTDLWRAHHAGAESTDGSTWWRVDYRRRWLVQYLECSCHP